MPKKDLYQVSLKAIIKNSKNEILILNAHNDGNFAGFYDFPGGRIDENEFNVPFEKILMREIKEEIGNVKIKLNPTPIALGRHAFQSRQSAGNKEIHVLYVFFEAKYFSGKIKISNEHLGFKWVKFNKQNAKKYFCSGILEGVRTYLK